MNEQSTHSDAHRGHKKEAKTTWAGYSPILFLMFPFALIVAYLLFVRFGESQETTLCMKRGGVRYTVDGVIRKAGPHFFVQSDQWRFITQGCNGRYMSQCLLNHPGIEALENNIGQPVSVEFCEEHLIAYRLAGQRYTHVLSQAESLKGTQ